MMFKWWFMTLRAVLFTLSMSFVAGLGCSGDGEFPDAAPDDAKTRRLYGTGKSDIWRVWDDRMGAGAMESTHYFFRHFDGKSSVDVTAPTAFTPNACGTPQEIVAVPGKLWLASTYLWACGQGADPPASRIILGTLSSDGTWTDHSDFLPKVSSPAQYDGVSLWAGYGVVLMSVRGKNSAYAQESQYFRLTDTGATKLLVTQTIGSFVFLGPDHIYFQGEVSGGGSGLTHKLEGDQLVALPSPITMPSGLLSRGGPEAWVWNANEVIHQPQNRVAYRFDGTSFQTVEFTVEETEEEPYGWQAIGIVPRGNGKATLLGARVMSLGYARSEHALTARQLDGTMLTGDAVVFGTVTCEGTGGGEACARISAAPHTILDDGTMIVTASGHVDEPYGLSMIDRDDIPR